MPTALLLGVGCPYTAAVGALAAPFGALGRSMSPSPSTWITICDTCKQEGPLPDTSAEASPGASPGLPAGARLAALVEAATAGVPGLATRRTSCLMGCDHGCNVAVQARGKLAYTLGRLDPTAEAADAVAAWARLHAESVTGQVPYRLWPPGVKGHFVTRHPPLPPEA